jgi:hypothetical protein
VAATAHGELEVVLAGGVDGGRDVAVLAQRAMAAGRLSIIRLKT